MLINAVLVAGAAAVMSLGLHTFTQKHLRFLDFSLVWHSGEWHVSVICWVVSVMGGVAILVPALLRKTYSANFAALGYVPSSGKHKTHINIIYKLIMKINLLFHIVDDNSRVGQSRHNNAKHLICPRSGTVHGPLICHRYL